MSVFNVDDWLDGDEDDVWWLNQGDDDWLTNDDVVWWLNLYVMVDDLMVLWDALLCEP